jgi:hypothetical protein
VVSAGDGLERHVEGLEDVKRWFADRGFGLVFEKEREVVWVGLTRLPSDWVVAPRYGRGSTDLAAAQRAKTRFQEEQ